MKQTLIKKEYLLIVPDQAKDVKELSWMYVAQCVFLQFLIRQVRWNVTPSDFMSN